MAQHRVHIDFGMGWELVDPSIIRSVVTGLGKLNVASLQVIGSDSHMDLILQADDMRAYSPFNRDGRMVPGRMGRYQYRADSSASWTTIWTGYLVDISWSRKFGELNTIQLKFYGNLRWLSRNRFHHFFSFGALDSETTAGPMINTILNQIQWSASKRAIDRGVSKLNPYAIALSGRAGTPERRVNPYEVLFQIASSETGYLYGDRFDNIIFEDRNRRVNEFSTGDPYRFSSEPADVARGAIAFQNIGLTGRYIDSVYNVFIAEHREFITTAVTNIWDFVLDTAIAVRPGTIYFDIDIDSNSENKTDKDIELVGQWISPLPFVHYEAFEKPNGTGDNLTHVLNISIESFDQKKCRIKVIASGYCNITKFIIRGAPVAPRQNYQIYEENQASIGKYDRRPFNYPAQVITDVEDARNHVRWLLSVYDEPQPLITLRIDGDQYPDATKWITIGTLVQVKDVPSDIAIDSNRYKYFYVEHEQHSVDVSNGRHEITYRMADADRILPAWKLGRSRLDATTGVYY